MQRSMPKALGDAVRGALQSSLVPAFEASCQSVFGQVAGTFDRGVAEMAAEMRGHAGPLQQALGSAQSLASSLEGTASRLAAAAAASAATPPTPQKTPIRVRCADTPALVATLGSPSLWLSLTPVSALPRRRAPGLLRLLRPSSTPPSRSGRC